MSSNVTAAQLEAQIAELEDLIAAEVSQWAQDMLDGEDPPPGGGPGHRSDGGAGEAEGREPKRTPKRAQQTLALRKAARAQLAARQEQKNQQELQARVAELEARVQKKQAAVARWEAAAAARLEARARKTAAGQRVRGRRPSTDIGEDREVKRARQALAKTRADCEAARQAAAAPASDPEAKINTADPSSRVMPLKKGGYDQLFNVQALATAKTQIILAITRHDSPVDARALAPLLEKAREVLDAAAITDEILKALFDAGYASDANFTLDIPAELYIAVTREARQTGRSEDGRATETMLPSWQDMTARLDTPEGKALYKKRSPTIEPVFAQLTARLGRTLNSRGDHADAELSLWAASHNLLKAIKARAARQARAAATPVPAPAAA